MTVGTYPLVFHLHGRETTNGELALDARTNGADGFCLPLEGNEEIVSLKKQMKRSWLANGMLVKVTWRRVADGEGSRAKSGGGG